MPDTAHSTLRPDADTKSSPVTPARAKATTEIIANQTERETKLIKSTEVYTTWFIGIAAAGIGICITQSGSISTANLLGTVLSQANSDLLIAVAAFLFLVGLAVGVTVRALLLGEANLKFRQATYLEAQLARIGAGECAPLPKMTTLRLYGALGVGHFLPLTQRSDFEAMTQKMTEYRAGSTRGWPVQLVATGLAIALLMLVAAL